MYIVVLTRYQPKNLCSILVLVPVVVGNKSAEGRQRGHGRVARDQVARHVANFCYALAIILTVTFAVVPPVNCHQIVSNPVLTQEIAITRRRRATPVVGGFVI